MELVCGEDSEGLGGGAIQSERREKLELTRFLGGAQTWKLSQRRSIKSDENEIKIFSICMYRLYHTDNYLSRESFFYFFLLSFIVNWTEVF